MTGTMIVATTVTRVAVEAMMEGVEIGNRNASGSRGFVTETMTVETGVMNPAPARKEGDVLVLTQGLQLVLVARS